MSKVLIIGCGGVASVAIHKCCQVPEVFTEICIASRTKSKCDKFKEELQDKTATKITTAQVDANDVDQLIALIEQEKPDIVINVALPYQDLTIMDACLATKTDYVDTANYEPEDTAKFEYKWQWAYRERFEKAGITALLGSGFDPGVTGVFCAYAQKHYFDEIHYIDILDCNGGDHGYPFATNFNPEINIREVSAKGSYIENGEWVETSYGLPDEGWHEYFETGFFTSYSRKGDQEMKNEYIAWKANEDTGTVYYKFADNPEVSSTRVTLEDDDQTMNVFYGKNFDSATGQVVEGEFKDVLIKK